MNRTYAVARIDRTPEVDANWNKRPWNGLEPLAIDLHMGDRPGHFPPARAKLAYDDSALYAIFDVRDRYVRAVAQKHQDPVCLDSCVEFFFTPGTDTSAGYFNLEMNCGGVMLFNFQVVPRKDAVHVAVEDCEKVKIAHSMPATVDPEIADPVEWTVEYRLPFEILGKYAVWAVKPGKGTEWRANFYKCADHTSHPHWLTWSPVARPKPDFHVPDSFGLLRFE